MRPARAYQTSPLVQAQCPHTDAEAARGLAGTQEAFAHPVWRLHWTPYEAGPRFRLKPYFPAHGLGCAHRLDEDGGVVMSARVTADYCKLGHVAAPRASSRHLRYGWAAVRHRGAVPTGLLRSGQAGRLRRLGRGYPADNRGALGAGSRVDAPRAWRAVPHRRLLRPDDGAVCGVVGDRTQAQAWRGRIARLAGRS